MNGWKRWFAFLLGASTILMVSEARAEKTLTAKIAVSAVVPPNCRLTVEPLAFGSYDPLGENSARDLDATASMILTCTRDSQASVVMDSGRNGSGRARSLAGAGSQLTYEIYRDPARTQAWASGADALRVVSRGLQSPSELVVYGRIPRGQEVPAGGYTDVITATVDF